MSKIKDYIQEVADNSDPENGDTLLPIEGLRTSFPDPLKCEFINLKDDHEA